MVLLSTWRTPTTIYLLLNLLNSNSNNSNSSRLQHFLSSRRSRGVLVLVTGRACRTCQTVTRATPAARRLSTSLPDTSPGRVISVENTRAGLTPPQQQQVVTRELPPVEKVSDLTQLRCQRGLHTEEREDTGAAGNTDTGIITESAHPPGADLVTSMRSAGLDHCPGVTLTLVDQVWLSSTVAMDE